MHLRPITEADRELITAAKELLRAYHVPGRHRCSSALRATSGEMYTGINLIGSGQTDVHSEQVAFGAAVTAGEDKIETSVAVIYEGDDLSNKMRIVSACGVCLEFFYTFAPTVDVILAGEEAPEKAQLSELLPSKEWPQDTSE